MSTRSLSSADGTVLAHGVGTRADLPLPLNLVIVGGGLAVAVSFLVLVLAWRRPRFTDTGGVPLPPALQRVVAAPVTRRLGQVVTTTLLLVVITAGWFGPGSIPANITPWAVYVTFWVGLVFLSLLLGPVWGVLNPLRLLHALLGARRTAVPRRADLLQRWGNYPAAVGLLAFTWLELAAPHRSEPRRLATVLAGYVLVQLAAAAVFGAQWFAQGEAFEVYARLIGRLSPLSRRPDGSLALVNPLRNASHTLERPGLTAVLVVLIGSTGFDGLTRTSAWQNGPALEGEAPTWLSTLALAGCIAAVAAAYLAATSWQGRGTPQRLAHSLIPIAVGYALAHYFSLLVFDGQTTYLLASDPYGTGLNLFGTAGKVVDYQVVSARTISVVQVAAIVVGHVVAAVLAHDRALMLPDGGSARASVLRQLPLLAVMVALTLSALALLLGA